MLEAKESAGGSVVPPAIIPISVKKSTFPHLCAMNPVMSRGRTVMMKPYPIHFQPPPTIVSTNPLPAPSPTAARNIEIPISLSMRFALTVV